METRGDQFSDKLGRLVSGQKVSLVDAIAMVKEVEVLEDFPKHTPKRSFKKLLSL